MDIFISSKRKYVVAGVITLVMCLLMVVCPDVAVSSVRQGIAIWTEDVLPAMLPFFICVNFMNNIGVVRLLPAPLFPFVMSILSGYPMGAKIIGDMCRSGQISLSEAHRLTGYCSTSNPVFIISAVGTQMMGSGIAGIVIAAGHYAGMLLNKMLYSLIYEKDTRDYSKAELKECDMVYQLSLAIFSAFRSLSVILAYIVIFMVFMGIAEAAGLFGMLGNKLAGGIVRGVFEMTSGCSYIAASGTEAVYICAAASAVISWGGFSVIAQSLSMLSGTGIRAGYLICTKLTHGIFAGIISLFIGFVMLS